MCRNIKTLYHYDPPATEEEIRASALQYVRKISGFRKPSRVNEEAFNLAVKKCAGLTRELINSLATTVPARKREPDVKKIS